MAKAQKGDLIRITNAHDNRYVNGEIFEVVKVGDDYEGVRVKCASSSGGYIGWVILDKEYEIHRKAGEEGVPVYTCDTCETKLGELACSSHLGGAFCSAECADTYVDKHEEPTEQDAVNSPNHYTQGRFETIEIIEEITQGYKDGYVAYCVGNALKYLARAPFKHGEPTEDIGKAAKYLSFALERLQTQE